MSLNNNVSPRKYYSRLYQVVLDRRTSALIDADTAVVSGDVLERKSFVQCVAPVSVALLLFSLVVCAGLHRCYAKARQLRNGEQVKNQTTQARRFDSAISGPSVTLPPGTHNRSPRHTQQTLPPLVGRRSTDTLPQYIKPPPYESEERHRHRYPPGYGHGPRGAGPVTAFGGAENVQMSLPKDHHVSQVTLPEMTEALDDVSEVRVGDATTDALRRG